MTQLSRTDLIAKYGDQIRMSNVEIRVDDTSGRYFLPDDSILRNQQVVGISIVAPVKDEAAATSYIVQNSPGTDRPLIVPDAFYNAYLFLLDASNTQLLYGVPLTQFATQPGDRNIQTVFAKGFTPSKSFVEIAAPGTAGRITAGQSILLHFWYLAAPIGSYGI